MSKIKISDVLKKTNLKYEEIVEKFEAIGKKVESEHDEFTENDYKNAGFDTRLFGFSKRQELLKQALERRKSHTKFTEVVIKETKDTSDAGKKKLSREEILKKKMELAKNLQQLDSEREKHRQTALEKGPQINIDNDEQMQSEINEQVISENVKERSVNDVETVVSKANVEESVVEEIKTDTVIDNSKKLEEPEVKEVVEEQPVQVKQEGEKKEYDHKKPYAGKKPWDDKKQSGYKGGERRGESPNKRREQSGSTSRPDRPPRQDSQHGYKGGGYGKPSGETASKSQHPSKSGGYRGDRPRQQTERPERPPYERGKKPDGSARGDIKDIFKVQQDKLTFTVSNEALLDDKSIRKKKWEEDEPQKAVEEVEVKKVKTKKATSKKEKNLKKDILESLDELNIEEEAGLDLGLVEELIDVEEPEEERNKRKASKQKEQIEDNVVTKPQKPNRIQIGESIVLSDLAGLLGVRIPEIIKKLMGMGIMATANQSLDAETVQLIALDYGIDVEVKAISEEDLLPKYEDKPESLKPRPPIVTVMGHVDHGKTSLLDAIRKTKVAEKEAGGITQHIGAYEVELNRGKIVFLDTPGHEAFTTLRARGANVTDIVILVVAADDGVMPQTKEAIDHARAAGVRIVVAINKIDKPNANPELVKSQLAEYGIISEEWGGEYQFQEISAKNRIGIDDLLERVLLEAEMLELKGNYDRPAEGIIIESRVDKQKGVSATLIVKNGTLRVGDIFVCGVLYGKVRAMFNYLGKSVKEAGPSIPVEIMGFSEVPEPGETFLVVPNEKLAKQITDIRLKKQQEKEEAAKAKLSLEDIFNKIKEGEIKELNIILKADVQGSLEALKSSLQKLSNSEVKVKIIHDGVGGINESDVLLAIASKAIIIGFNVRPDAKAKTVAEREKVDVRLYSVIYQAIEEVQKAIEGMLTPEVKENVIGKVEIRKVFSVPKVGKVAGCYVLEGKIFRNSNVRIIRDNVVVYTGKISSLKRFQDDVREVVAGYECGLGIANYNDIKEGDILEVFEMVEEKRTLKDVSE
ncbi:MAG: translation initiation factor IF-2 [Deferribacterales bacterium]